MICFPSRCVLSRVFRFMILRRSVLQIMMFASQKREPAISAINFSSMVVEIITCIVYNNI